MQKTLTSLIVGYKSLQRIHILLVSINYKNINRKKIDYLDD